MFMQLGEQCVLSKHFLCIMTTVVNLWPTGYCISVLFPCEFNRSPARPDQTSGAQSLFLEQRRLLPHGDASLLLHLDRRICKCYREGQSECVQYSMGVFLVRVPHVQEVNKMNHKGNVTLSYRKQELDCKRTCFSHTHTSFHESYYCLKLKWRSLNWVWPASNRLEVHLNGCMWM